MNELKATKRYCAANTKYYKDRQASGEIGHVLRSFKHNENCFPSLTKDNFGHTFSDHKLNLKQYYDIKLIEAKDSNSRAMQKNSNTYIDSVLIFDRDRFNKLLQDGQQNAIMIEFQALYGFEPIGFEFHLDEGTELENGEIKHNYHAHAIFLNYDFNEKKTCLRIMNKDDWRNSQSLLHKHFKHLGFDRGEVKNTNKKVLKEKLDYVRDLAYQVKKLEQTNRKCETKNLMLLNDKLDLMDEIEEAKGRLKTLDTAKEAVKNIAKVLRKKRMYQNIQRLIPKPVFDYFSDMAQIIYKALTGNIFQLEQTSKSLHLTIPTNTQTHNQSIKANAVGLSEIEKSKNEELNKIKLELNTLLVSPPKKTIIKPKNRP